MKRTLRLSIVVLREIEKKIGVNITNTNTENFLHFTKRTIYQTGLSQSLTATDWVFTLQYTKKHSYSPKEKKKTNFEREREKEFFQNYYSITMTFIQKENLLNKEWKTFKLDAILILLYNFRCIEFNKKKKKKLCKRILFSCSSRKLMQQLNSNCK